MRQPRCVQFAIREAFPNQVITVHWSDARARLADESHITHERVESMVRLLGDDSCRQITDLTPDLAPQRDVYGSWAESS